MMIKKCENPTCCNFFTKPRRVKKYCSRRCQQYSNGLGRKDYHREHARKRYNEDAAWREHRKKYNREYAKKCGDEVKQKINNNRNVYRQNRQKVDINYKLRRTLPARIKAAIKHAKTEKCDKSINLLGCSINEVRKYLEAQFLSGMTWDNHGDWHIDHIKPCVAFDLSDPEQQRECFHYTNLQPLWAEENLQKAGYYEPSQPEI